jgi:hypothetical protein
MSSLSERDERRGLQRFIRRELVLCIVMVSPNFAASELADI